MFNPSHLFVDLFGISFKARIESFGKDVTVPLQFKFIYLILAKWQFGINSYFGKKCEGFSPAKYYFA